MQRYFKTTPPAVHQMVATLEKRGLITRVPRQPRTIRVLLSRAELSRSGMRNDDVKSDETYPHIADWIKNRNSISMREINVGLYAVSASEESTVAGR